MDAITLYQAVSIFQAALVALDRLFEFWLGATFAVIVASHLGSQVINSKFAILIGVLYLLFNTLVILRMIATVRGHRNRVRTTVRPDFRAAYPDRLFHNFFSGHNWDAIFHSVRI